MARARQGVARRRHDPGKAGPQLRHRHPRPGGRDVRRRRRHDPPARVRPGADPGQRRPGGGQGDLPDVGRSPPGCHPHPRDADGDLRRADATRHDRPRRGDGSHPARRASRRADADRRRRARLLPVGQPGGPDRGRRRRRPGVAGAEEPRAGRRHGGRRGRRARAGIAGAGAPGGDDHLPDAARPPDRDTRTAVRDDAAGRGSRLDAGGPPARRARRGRPPHAQLRDRRQDPPDGVQGRGVQGPPGWHGDDLPERRADFDQRALGRRHARHRHAGVGRGGRRGARRGARPGGAGPSSCRTGTCRPTPRSATSRARRSACSTSACSSGRSPTACGAACWCSWASPRAAWRWCTWCRCGSPAGSPRPSTAWPSPPSASRRATTPRRSTAGATTSWATWRTASTR